MSRCTPTKGKAAPEQQKTDGRRRCTPTKGKAVPEQQKQHTQHYKSCMKVVRLTTVYIPMSALQASSKRQQSACPLSAAAMRGVTPSMFDRLGSAFASNSCKTAWLFPFVAAASSAVHPLLSCSRSPRLQVATAHLCLTPTQQMQKNQHKICIHYAKKG